MGRTVSTDQSKQNPLEDGAPAVAKVLEAVPLEPARLDGNLTEALEGGDGADGEHDEQDKKGQAGQEQIRGFDAGAEGEALDARQDDTSVGVGRSAAGRLVLPSDQGRQRVTGDTIHGIQRALLDLDRRLAQTGKQGRGRPAGGALIPGKGLLHEADLHDAHGPGEILRPGLGERGQIDGGHADHGLGLEVAEQRQRVGGDVGRRVGVAQGRGEGRGDETQAGDDGRRPAHTGLVDRLGVGQLRLEAGDAGAGVGRVDVDAHEAVQVGNGVGDVGHLLDDIRPNLGEVGVEGELAGAHGTETAEVEQARVEGLADGAIAVGEDLDLGRDVADDGRGANDVDVDDPGVGREGDVEFRGREAGVWHADVERLGLDELLGCGQGGPGQNGGEQRHGREKR